MSNRMSKDNAKELVEFWQLNEVKQQADRTDTTVASFDTKLDQIITLLNSRPTIAEVDAKIEIAVKNAVEKQDLKYAPIVGSNKWLLGLLLTSGLGLFGSLIFIAIGLTK